MVDQGNSQDLQKRCGEGGRSMSRNLSVMMLTLGVPTKIIGGISPHVQFLSKSLGQATDVKVYVVTCDFPGAPAHEVMDGVRNLPHRLVQESLT